MPCRVILQDNALMLTGGMIHELSPLFPVIRFDKTILWSFSLGIVA